jgi:uncharacterized protein (TIGR00730 family)
MKSICVYCGSSVGLSPIYTQAAKELARALVNRNINLVYGGGNVGLMKVIADEVMSLGGHVTGVIPKALMHREVGHRNLQTLHIVEDMHERKAMMAKLSDAFIAMPGGIGTLEELFEMFTWLQLGFHKKPLALYNVEGFYDLLMDFLNHTVQQQFLKQTHLELLINQSDPTKLLNQLQNFIDNSV